MLALLNRVKAMIAADDYLSATSRLGKTGGGVRVYAQYPVPAGSYPCLVLTARVSGRPDDDGISRFNLFGWLMSTEAAVSGGRVLTTLNGIYYYKDGEGNAEGIRSLLDDKPADVCSPSDGLYVWSISEAFKADALQYIEKTGVYSMAFQYSGLGALA